MGPSEALFDAAKAGNLSGVQEAMARGADPNSRDNSLMECVPLRWACVYGHLDVARYLVENGADVNARDRRKSHAPLHDAVEYPELVKLLVENGADVDAADDDGLTPLLAACIGGCLDSAKLLIEHGANVNHANRTSRYTPLMAAANYGHVAVAQLLLDNYADVNATNTDGHSALWAAVKFGYPKLATLLRKAGAR